MYLSLHGQKPINRVNLSIIQLPVDRGIEWYQTFQSSILFGKEVVDTANLGKSTVGFAVTLASWSNLYEFR